MSDDESAAYDICGYRQDYGLGVHECVIDADLCDGRHYFVKINEGTKQ